MQARKPLRVLNDEFDFDWNNYRTIETNKNKIVEIENAMPIVDVLPGEKKALGLILYKLGTYYNHVARNPVKALDNLTIAGKILTGNEWLWTQNHILYSWQQLYVAAKKKNDQEKMAEIRESFLSLFAELFNAYMQDDSVESVKIYAFGLCVQALMQYEMNEANTAIKTYRHALDLYEDHALLDDQYARAKNRYAQFLAEQNRFDEADVVFAELEMYWSLNEDRLNPYSARFYVAHADYLLSRSHDNSALALVQYKKAYEILCVIEGKESGFSQDVLKKITNIQNEPSQALNSVLEHLGEQLMTLPFSARDILIESISTMLLRGFVPMSGMTVQQHIRAKPEILAQLNSLTNKQDVYTNSVDARYVYQFAREATSAGILPAYIDNKTGELYMAFVCNQRNLQMLNWSAGYSEAARPSWRGKLLSEGKQDIHYNREKLNDSARKTMISVLEEQEGDWTRVEYDFSRFEKEFKSDGIVLPPTDINSFHTASRECKEEINLDVSQFPERKIFLVSHDNTLGISQGDAPGQVSNRSHQYLVFLGHLGEQPEIKPGDDVVIAKWIKVSDIMRKSPTEYVAHERPLCIYMLRAIENGLKNLWNYLLQQASTRQSFYSSRMIARFSTPENLLAEIESFCGKHEINIHGTSLVHFMQCLAGELPAKTYTGNHAQQLLNCMLKTAEYLLSPELDPKHFLTRINKILSPLESPTKLMRKSASLLQFKPAGVKVESGQELEKKKGMQGLGK